VVLEAMMDAADLALSPTPSSGRQAFFAPNEVVALSPSGRAFGDGGSVPSVVLPSSATPMAMAQCISFSAKDIDRSTHVLTGPAHVEAVQDDARPLSRAEVDRPRNSLRSGPIFDVKSSYDIACVGAKKKLCKPPQGFVAVIFSEHGAKIICSPDRCASACNAIVRKTAVAGNKVVDYTT